MLDLRITNLTSRFFDIDEVELRLPWNDNLFEWLPPETIQSRNYKQRNREAYEQYRFPGRYGLELPLEEVINHVLTSGGGLPPRRPVCGWLLAIGGLMPRNLFPGGWINGELVITTSDHAEYCEPIRFWTERPERKKIHSDRKPNPYENLFDEPALNKEPGIRKLDSATSVPGRRGNAIAK